jgi:hypothetical protein
MHPQKVDTRGRIVVSNRVDRELWNSVLAISVRRGEKVGVTLDKALRQYVSADARRK